MFCLPVLPYVVNKDDNVTISWLHVEGHLVLLNGYTQVENLEEEYDHV